MLEAKIVEVIKTVGPRNISAIAAYLGIPKETCRYVVRKRFPALGLSFSVNVDYGNVGLLRVLVVFRCSDNPEGWFRKVFIQEYDGERAARFYLSYYARLMSSGDILAVFAIPPDMRHDLISLMEKLRKLRLVEEYRMIDLAYFSTISIKADKYDFENARWNFQWDRLKIMEATPEVPESQPENAEFDYVDLRVLSELQNDPSSKLSRVAESAGFPRNLAVRHYRDHVTRRSMIRGYDVVWTSKEKGGAVYLFWHIQSITNESVNQVRSVLCSLPFGITIAKSRRGDEMFCLAPIHPNEIEPSQRFATVNLPEGVRCETQILDSSFFGSFAIPHEYYDSEREAWKPSIRLLLENIENLLLQMGGK